MDLRVSTTVIACALFVACGTPVRSPPQYGLADANTRAYPARLPVISDEELADRAELLVRETPGWTILLDTYGMLASATCNACEETDPADLRLTDSDRMLIASFFAAPGDIVGLDAPGVIERPKKDVGLLFEQRTAWGSAGSVWVDRFGATVRIQGHMWPMLPAAGEALSDEVVLGKLRALDARQGLSISRRYVHTQPNEGMPVEIHEAACLSPDDPVAFRHGWPRSPPASPPCVDARTGERLTPVCEAIRFPTGTSKTKRVIAPCL